MKQFVYPQLVFIFVFLALSNSLKAQTPVILIDGTSVLASADAKFPMWLKAGQTLNIGTNVVGISVMEFNLVPSTNGNDLALNQIILVNSLQTVPAGKAWKVESALLNPALSSLSNGWVDDGTTVRLNTASDKVGIGTSTPAQKLSVAGTIESTSGGYKFPDGTTQTTAANGITIRKGQYTLVSGITYSGSLPTTTYALPITVPSNTKAVFIAVRYTHNGANDHGYLSFWAYQQGATASDDRTYFDNYHFNDYFNTDYYEQMIPWNYTGSGNAVTIQVTQSHNTNAQNTYSIYFTGYLAGP